MPNFRLDNKIAIVTGCNKGIGLQIAIALAEHGSDIIGVSSKMTENGHTVREAVEKMGRKFFPYNADFNDRTSLYKFLDQVKTNHTKIDILVNNAGNIKRAPASGHPDDFWDDIININLNAQFIITREIGKQMISNGYGKIIFTASLLSFQGGINVPGYAASKGAIASLIKAFANEWAKYNITINGIAPGYIATDNTAALRTDADRNTSILSRIPAGRWGQPEDLSGGFVFLSSPASDYVNGTILTIDGGWMGR